AGLAAAGGGDTAASGAGAGSRSGGRAGGNAGKLGATGTGAGASGVWSFCQNCARGRSWLPSQPESRQPNTPQRIAPARTMIKIMSSVMQRLVVDCRAVGASSSSSISLAHGDTCARSGSATEEEPVQDGHPYPEDSHDASPHPT